MRAVKFACPHCQTVLRAAASLPDGTKIKCASCQKVFPLRADTQQESTGVSHAGTTRLPAEVLETPPPPRPTLRPSPPRPVVSVRRPQQGSGAGRWLVLFFILFLFLAGSATAGVFVFWKDLSPAADADKKASASSDAVAKTTQPPAATEPAQRKKTEPASRAGAPKSTGSGGRPAVRPVKSGDDPVMARPKHKKRGPIDKATVSVAIDRGVRYLKGTIHPSGSWKPDDELNSVGHAALPALALLECGVSGDDVVIQTAARYVRQYVPHIEETYDIGTALLLLDRLGDPSDKLAIRALALRLIAGQNETGTWGYKCPKLDVKEGEELANQLERNRSRLDLLVAITAPSGAGRLPGSEERLPEKQDAPPLPPVPLSPKVAQLPVVKFYKASDPEQFKATRGDNSNTQFALLGLWVARRHGIPVEISLEFAARHFRQTQNGDGGWGYVTGNPTKNTMTCVGLMAMAMGHGAAAEAFQQVAARDGKPPRPPINDPAIKDGLVSLGKYLEGTDKEIRGLESRIELYLIWALERIGVLYQRDTFGRTNWYQWGAWEVLDRQEADGRWETHYHPAVDTSFALLFLRRSNLIGNLTRSLRTYLDNLGPDGE